MSAKKEEVESALKDVKHVSKGNKGKRTKSCVSNCMEKVLFIQVIRDEISFWKVKKIRKIIQKSFWYFFGLILYIMIVLMKWMIDQEREREEELKQWYIPYQ